MEKNIVLYESRDGQVKLDVQIDGDNIWLNRHQIAKLFDRDVKTIGKHINNALNEELKDFLVVAKFATTKKYGRREGFTQQIETEYYNLDVIISVGYRVKSKYGIDFRRWANKVLKEYILKGYTVNQHRMNQLNQVIQIMKRLETDLDTKQVLSVVEHYNTALSLLDDYDHQKITRPKGNQSIYVITYEECKNLIETMRFSSESDLFGHEKDNSFEGSISTIYQTFGGKELYPTLEEKEIMVSVIMNCLCRET